MSQVSKGRAMRALKFGVSTGALALAMAVAGAAAAQTAPAAQDDTAVEEVVVTGFRRSLDQALSAKRQSVAAVDVIVAEDIAKFPDQNLAESLQRRFKNYKFAKESPLLFDRQEAIGTDRKHAVPSSDLLQKESTSVGIWRLQSPLLKNLLAHSRKLRT